MLTKTIKFDTDILEILRGLTWSPSGLSAVIHQRLDRKQYEKTNKALEAMGGKWNRIIQAHIFPDDPRPLVDGLLETGALVVERDGFFETPEPVVRRMLELAPLEDYMDVLEPSAGKGAIARVMVERVPTIRLELVEKNSDRCFYLDAEFWKAPRTYCADFLTFFTGEKYDRVVMNPPFEEGQDIEHVRHAYKFLKPGGILVSVMSEGVFFRSDRKATDFREWLGEIRGYSERLPEGAFKSSGTGVSARLVVIKK